MSSVWKLRALSIGKALLADLYDDELVASQEPFTVSQEDDLWVVTGTSKDRYPPAAIVLSKKDASLVHLEIPPIEIPPVPMTPCDPQE